MMKLKKLFLCILTLLLVLSGCSQTTPNSGNDADKPKEDVTFTGVGTGHNGQVNVDVTFNSEGKIVNGVERADKKQTALVVTMEQPQELYLRGFTG